VDASFDLGVVEDLVEVDQLVDLVDPVLDGDVFIRVTGFEYGLEAVGGGEVCVRRYAFSGELVLPEPAVVLVHALVVGACRWGGWVCVLGLGFG